jgi:cation diffusion facilitator family transporter
MLAGDKVVVSKLKKITVISAIFMIIEILGGYYSNSIAIFADAFHLLSDVLAYIISLAAVLMSYHPSPKGLTFGYEKLQPLGALLNVSIIWFVTAELFI